MVNYSWILDVLLVPLLNEFCTRSMASSILLELTDWRLMILFILQFAVDHFPCNDLPEWIIGRIILSLHVWIEKRFCMQIVLPIDGSSCWWEFLTSTNSSCAVDAKTLRGREHDT